MISGQIKNPLRRALRGSYLYAKRIKLLALLRLQELLEQLLQQQG